MRKILEKLFGNKDLPLVNLEFIENITSLEIDEAKSILENYGFKYIKYVPPIEQKKGYFEYKRKAKPIEGMSKIPEFIEIHETVIFKRGVSYKLNCIDKDSDVFSKHHLKNLMSFTIKGKYKPDLTRQGRFIKEKSPHEKFYLSELSGKLKSGVNMFSIDIYFVNEIMVKIELMDKAESKYAITNIPWEV